MCSLCAQMRELVVSMILATDNAVHAAVVSEYSDRMARVGEEPLNLKENLKDCCIVFGVMLHCADVSNVRATPVARRTVGTGSDPRPVPGVPRMHSPPNRCTCTGGGQT